MPKENYDALKRDKTMDVILLCSGSSYKPFDQSDNGLGVTILKRWRIRPISAGKTALPTSLLRSDTEILWSIPWKPQHFYIMVRPEAVLSFSQSSGSERHEGRNNIHQIRWCQLEGHPERSPRETACLLFLGEI